jgi:hypothetical protein
MKAQPEPIRFKGYKTFFYVADAKDELEYLLLTRCFFKLVFLKVRSEPSRVSHSIGRFLTVRANIRVG